MMPGERTPEPVLLMDQTRMAMARLAKVPLR
jgi:hypothetical protein